MTMCQRIVGIARDFFCKNGAVIKGPLVLFAIYIYIYGGLYYQFYLGILRSQYKDPYTQMIQFTIEVFLVNHCTRALTKTLPDIATKRSYTWQ